MLAEYVERETQRAAAAVAKRQQEVAATWRQLLITMWTRLQLQRRYSKKGGMPPTQPQGVGGIIRGGAKAKGSGVRDEVDLDGEAGVVGGKGKDGGGGGRQAATAVQQCLVELQEGVQQQGKENGGQKGTRRKLPWQEGIVEEGVGGGGGGLASAAAAAGAGADASPAAAEVQPNDDEGDGDMPEVEHF